MSHTASLPAGNIAIIGGTGMEQLPPEIFAEPVMIDTPGGTVQLLSVSNNYTEPYKLYFLSRHGASHHLAPHQIDYRNNIIALKKLDVTCILATNAVGSLKSSIRPGSLVLLDDFIDYTKNRHVTFSQGTEPWKHTDFTYPYSRLLRTCIQTKCSELGIDLVSSGTYLCVDGPRFETPAEIRMFASWNADVVGMTGLPEAIFAMEAEIHYAAIAIVTNMGAGLGGENALVSHNDVLNVMFQRLPEVRELLLQTCGVIRDNQTVLA